MHGGETTVRLRTPFRAYGPVRLALRGAHQVANAVVAVRLLEALEFAGIGGGREAITTGLADAPWPGRLERRTFAERRPRWSSTAPTTRPAPKRSRDGCATRSSAPMTLVTACMRDKDVPGLLSPLLPLADARRGHGRRLPAGAPGRRPRGRPFAPSRRGCRCRWRASPAAAMAAASEHGARTVVAGSLFLVGAVRAWLDDGTGPARSRVIFCGSPRPTFLPSPCTRF